jgi:putative spermidine/putrescine transport system ATP-binding protein
VAHLELLHLTKSFGSTAAVRDLSITVERGEILSILGPSGCGKTTTLRMIAGLETPTSGKISFNGKDITSLPARSRKIGLVFQNYALFPHLDVFENVAFGLRTRRTKPETAVEERVRKALAGVRMDTYERRAVHQLSGGQQQRIALARALAIEPDLLLLDEPLSNLDPALREDLRDQMRSIIRELNMTTVFVTHEQQEALTLADRIAIMESGVCRQIGAPGDVYSRPSDAFVAQFLGKANVVPGGFLGLKGAELAVIRPENIRLGEGSRSGKVSKTAFEGPIVNYMIDADGQQLNVRQFHRGGPIYRVGETVRFEIPADGIHRIAK